MDLRCSKCGRPAPPAESAEMTMLWRGGEAGMVFDDPLMFEDLVCPDCQPEDERHRREAEFTSAEPPD